MSVPDSHAGKSASSGDDVDARIDAAFARAFAGEASRADAPGDAARIDAAIAKALAARPPVNGAAGGAARVRPTLVLLAAALAVGAAAYASLGGEKRTSTPPSAPAALVTEHAVIEGAGAATATATVTEPAAPSAPEAPVGVPAVAATAARAKATAPPSVTKPVASAPSAAELFARANAARRDGRWDSAIADYRALYLGYPDARETPTARIALARLLLERLGDADAALPLFDAYLADSPDGTLAEEARVGRALAKKKQGDAAGERAAWEDVLRAHPTSVNAPRARERIEALAR